MICYTHNYKKARLKNIPKYQKIFALPLLYELIYCEKQ